MELEARKFSLTYDIPETAKTLRISPDMVRRLIASGELPARKIGARTVILYEELYAFVKSRPFVRSQD